MDMCVFLHAQLQCGSTGMMAVYPCDSPAVWLFGLGFEGGDY